MLAFVQESTVPPTWWAQQDAWLRSVMIVAAAIVLYFIVRRFVLGPLQRMAQGTDNDLDDRLLSFAGHLLGIVVTFAVLMLVLLNHDVDVTPFLAGAGIVGVALGFAAKETLADILAGIFLVFDRPMRVGDRVKIEHIGREWGGWGDVVDVGLRRTQIRNTDGVVVSYPNNLLANSVITNFSHERAPIRVRVRFQVDYSADLEAARQAAIRAIDASEGVIAGTAEIMTRAMWDDSRGHTVAGVLMEGRYRIERVADRTRIRSRVLENLLRELRAAGVPLAAPRLRVDTSPAAG